MSGAPSSGARQQAHLRGLVDGAQRARNVMNRWLRKPQIISKLLRPIDHARWGLSRDESLALDMLEAAWAGKPGFVQKAVERGAQPDLRVPLEKLPVWMKGPRVEGNFLHWAAETVTDLRSTYRIAVACQDPNTSRSDGETALSLAARHGDLDLVTSFAMLGADIDQKINGEDMAVALAAAGSFRGARLLQENRARLRGAREFFLERDLRERAALQNALKSEGAERWQDSTSSRTVSLSSARQARLEIKKAELGETPREAALRRIASMKVRQAKIERKRLAEARAARIAAQRKQRGH